jgi:proteasome accessory factor B
MSMVRQTTEPAPVVGAARIWVAAGRAYGLRRMASVIGPYEHSGQPGDELELELRSIDIVARWLAGHGPDVAVLDPPELAKQVQANWAAAAAVHGVEVRGPVSDPVPS